MFNNRSYPYGSVYGPNYPQYGGVEQTGAYQSTQYQQQQMQQPIMPPQQLPQPMSVRVVASREEALAVPVDFMGNAIYMHDVAHGRIYRKAWNSQSGAAEFEEYGILPKMPESKPMPPMAYATEEQVKALEARFTELESYIKDNV